MTLRQHSDGIGIQLSPRVTARMSLYLRCLESWQREGVVGVSSGQIVEALGLRQEQVAQVRKDLGYLGGMGKPGIGYPVQELIQAIRSALGLDRSWNAVLVGAGNLGRALLNYPGFSDRGFALVGVFDIDPAKIGTTIGSHCVLGLHEIAAGIPALQAELALISVPAESAQGVALRLVEAGIRGILNFAPVVLRLPKGVRLVNVDLAMQLEQLASQIGIRR